jgi:CheY-like chemotaxis protein
MELAAERQPDLILLDLNMPGLDGYEVCRRLKENPVTRKIAVIFVSARDHEDDEYRGFTLGAVDYINKPINLQILNARIMVQLRIKQLLEQQKRQTDSLIQSLRQNSVQAESEQEQLRRQNRGLLAVLDSVPEKILLEDTSGRITWGNRPAQEFFGMDGLTGRPGTELLKSKGVGCEECPLSLPQGGPPCRSLLHLPLFDEEGEQEGTAHILADEKGGPAQLCHAAETAIDGFIGQNRKAVRDSLNTILFGIDAISSILRDNREFDLISRPVIKAAEELDRIVCSLLDFQPQDKDS